MSNSTINAWAAQQWGSAALGDKRRTQRGIHLAAQMAALPAAGLPGQTQSWSELKAAYRLLHEDDVTHQALSLPHWQHTWQLAEHISGPVLFIQDGSPLDFTLRQAQGLGRIRDDKSQGLLIHTTLAVQPDFAGSCRFVYNKALALQKDNHVAGNKFIGYVAMAKLLTGWRNGAETPWLREAPCHALKHALRDLEKAYKNFFEKRAAFPSFKRKGSGDSFRYSDPKQIKLDQVNDRLFLPKLGWLRFRNSRDVLGEVRNVTVSQSDGKWFASIQTQREVAQPLPTATTAIGIDVGIARFATMSDASFIAPLNSFKKHQQRLARYQRRMSRKVKFSNNWKKAKTRVQKIHTRIANARKDFLHKTTTTISQNPRSFALRICRCGTCPGLPRARSNNRAKTCARKAASIVASSIRGGASSGDNLVIRSRGTAACFKLCRPTTPARPVRAAAT